MMLDNLVSWVCRNDKQGYLVTYGVVMKYTAEEEGDHVGFEVAKPPSSARDVDVVPEIVVYGVVPSIPVPFYVGGIPPVAAKSVVVEGRNFRQEIKYAVEKGVKEQYGCKTEDRLEKKSNIYTYVKFRKCFTVVRYLLTTK